MINLLFEYIPFVFLTYSEQIALYTIIDFNSWHIFCIRTIYNKINKNDKIRIINGFVAA